MDEPPVYHLFDVYGVELEYMIVAADTLSVLPVTDEVLHAVSGEYTSDVEFADISWSNELALHVVELKTAAPVTSLDALPQQFLEHVRRINDVLKPLGGRLMPTATHPWMDPFAEMRLWPHDYSPIYEAFNRIFDCRGHGWANLQSVHLNLPFAGDDEFGRLHAAIRLLLPIMPALAASSPIMDGRRTGLLDARLDVYRTNSQKIPAITGAVIPERVYTRADYQHGILDRLYAEIAPYDPEGTLQHEWLNARGAIARFERHTIEIRVLDVQECPAADVAICAAISQVLQALIGERWTGQVEQQAFATEPLHQILLDVVRDGERAVIADRAYLSHFGCERDQCSAGELWQHLRETLRLSPEAAGDDPLTMILNDGPLARRILTALGNGLSHDRLRSVYRELCECLQEGRMFRN